MFDGGSLLIPAVHHQVDMSKFPLLGIILSHGYLACGILPVRVAFPVLACILMGTSLKVPDRIIVESFIDYVVCYEGEILKEGFAASMKLDSCRQFVAPLLAKLTNLLSRFGCRELPKPDNLKRLVIEIARHEFTVKAVGAIFAMHTGIPHQHQPFWKEKSIEELYSLYKSLDATPARVMEMIAEPEEMNSAQERVFGYLIQFVGSLKRDDLRLFLRYVTGSSVVIAEQICVVFNATSVLSRLPVGHTCNATIELPYTYQTYPDFVHDFRCVMQSEYGWLMDVV